MSSEDLNRRRHRYRDQHAEESEQAAAGDDRQQDPDRMQINAAAQNPGAQYCPFEKLSSREDRHHANQTQPALVLGPAQQSTR